MAKTQFNRRNFLQTSAIGASALSLSAASAARVYGANEKINIAFLGVGGRCQQHVDVILQMQKENKNVVPFAVCDVWDGDPKLGNVDEKEMYTVFNMGIGFVMIVSRFFAQSIVSQLTESGIPSWVIGEIVEDETGVDLV